MNQLPVFNIERFAIHDGEGIRTVVFLQGCPLHCAWCSNPESQKIGRKLMFLDRKCSACGACVSACPNRAIIVTEGKKTILRNQCTACGECASVCPNEAMSISGVWMTPKEIFDTVIRDKDYYEESHGGITLSGGEPLNHIRSLIPLLTMCRSEDIRIAAETCGHVPAQNIVLAEQWVDDFLFDVKTLNREKFHRLTGGNLDLILSNFRLLAKLFPEKITVRVPVIPGLNYSQEELNELFEYVLKNGVKRMDLLPYHTLGLTKYRQLGMVYPMKDTKPLNRQDLLPFQETGTSMGLNIRIGG